ncbi:MAG: dihydrofolate reductase [Bifidobacteriaceae bacterium]|jgi:dihydrofolate reductase|nr:dihydrofolate reductase [Bifidobacteriaceae bacterium]
MTTEVALIWAQSRGGVIASGGAQPWRLPEDLERFKELTWGHPVVMGRATWEALPQPNRPLPGRTNLVLTRQPDWAASGAVTAPSPAEALARAAASGLPGPVWVIGGAAVYRAFADLAGRAEVTVIDTWATGDTYAPAMGPNWRLIGREPARGWLTSVSSLRYRFETWLQGQSPS